MQFREKKTQITTQTNTQTNSILSMFDLTINLTNLIVNPNITCHTKQTKNVKCEKSFYKTNP